MAKCEIQWIDADGKPTPDDNESIGRIRSVARYQQIGGEAIWFDRSRWLHVCAEHAKRLSQPGMEHWEREQQS